MKNHLTFKIIIFYLLISKVFALYSLNSTMSSGYYQDRLKKGHSTIFFDFKHNYLHKSGVETFIDLGINNNFKQDKWGAYPQQFHINIPLDNGFKEAPFYKSRVIIGRQLLTEGFDINIIDGAQIPYYFSPNFGLTIYGGVLHVLEESKINLDNKIYGGSFFVKKWNTMFKMGPSLRARDDQEKVLTHLSISKEFDNIFLSPILFGKTQYDFTNAEIDQTYLEGQFALSNTIASISYSSRKPDTVLLPERNFIYNLISIDNQETISTAIHWDSASELSMGAKVDYITFKSNYKNETGNKEEIYLQKRWFKHKALTYISRITSYGGDLYQTGIDYSYNFNEFKSMLTKINVAKVEKVNGIEGYFYHGHFGMNFNFWEKWRSLFSIEVERNHLFDFDVKAVMYATYFHY